MAVFFLSTHQLKSSLSFLWDILWFPALRGPPINPSLFSEDYREDKDKIFLSLCFLCYPIRGKFIVQIQIKNIPGITRLRHSSFVSLPLLLSLGHLCGLVNGFLLGKTLKLHLQCKFGFATEIYSGSCSKKPNDSGKMHRLGEIKRNF